VGFMAEDRYDLDLNKRTCSCNFEECGETLVNRFNRTLYRYLCNLVTAIKPKNDISGRVSIYGVYIVLSQCIRTFPDYIDLYLVVDDDDVIYEPGVISAFLRLKLPGMIHYQYHLSSRKKFSWSEKAKQFKEEGLWLVSYIDVLCTTDKKE
jgi:hypothetical protein